jgi:hypothetical protein
MTRRCYQTPCVGTHFVLLFAAENTNIWFHDPGLPAHRSMKLPIDQFFNAMGGETIVVPTGNYKFSPATG